MQPTVRSALLLAAGLPVALLPAVVDARLWTAWLALFAASLVAILADALVGMPRRRLGVGVELPEMLYIGDADPMRITLSPHRRRRALAVDLIADLDPLLAPQTPQSVLIGPDGGVVDVRLEPRRRGTAVVNAIWIRWTGPLGLWRRTLRHPVGESLAVVPNIRAVREAALRLANARDFVVGVRRRKFIGDGSSFDRLEEYRPGLDHKAMDYKASARHRKLIVRRYEAERNHQIILAFDTGRLMGEALDGVPRVDRAINAGLLLAYLGLKAGDRVGLFAFDSSVRLFTEPAGGIRSLGVLQRRAAELAYADHETNYTLGLNHLATRLRRRSLVVVLTDFVDPITAELMVENVVHLARRHVVVFVALRDPELDGLVAARPDDLLDVHRAVAARDLVVDRETVLERLRRSGVFCIDAAPDAVSAAMINRYLEISRRELV